MLILVVLANSMTAFSAPPFERQTGETARWVSAPTTRGTFNLLLSCTLTLSLCLWTSLHLNIPRADDTWRAPARKVGYTLVALVAPEFIVFTTWLQYVSAKSLSEEINKALERKGRSDRWTTAHGFYAGMGGIVLDVDDPTNPFIPSKHKRLTLTAKGVVLLAKCGYLPPPSISKQFIDDKSKTDALGKSLVCVQAAWCLMQYVGRKASHLPVTLLELNTLGHALCAFVIYLFWWSKPLDIKHPSLLSDEYAAPHSLCAYMWMCSGVSYMCFGDRWRYREQQLVKFSLPSEAGTNTDPESTDDQPVELREGETLPGTGFHFHSTIFEPQSMGPPENSYMTERLEKFCLLPGHIRRWRLANKAIIEYGEFIRISEDHKLEHEQFLTKRVSNHPYDADLLEADISRNKLALGLGFLSAGYGGLHASEWNSFFLTREECYMWRISCVVVAAVGIAFAIRIMVGHGILKLVLPVPLYWLNPAFPLEDWCNRILRVGPQWENHNRNWMVCILFNLYGFVLVSCALCCTLLWALIILTSFVLYMVCVGVIIWSAAFYLACRVFLVVEAFISIRELPIETYQTPTWTQLLPHL